MAGNVKAFNKETSYLLWDAEHDAAPVTFSREDANSVVFYENGTELVFEQGTVVNLGSRHPPDRVAREAGKHYISTDDSGASNQENSLAPSQESEGSYNSQGSGNSRGTGGENETQSGGRRKNGKKTKKTRKAKKAKRKSRKGKSLK
jgi:hypothetical protein